MKSLRGIGARFTRSLRGQLMLSTTLPVLALLLGLSVVGVFGFTRMTQTLLEQRDAELVQLAAQQMADFWADSVLLLSQLAATTEVRQARIQAIQQLLDANVALQQRFDDIAVTDADGVVIAATSEAGGDAAIYSASMVGEQVGGLSYFARTRELRRPIRSRPYLDGRGRRIIAVSVPVFDIWGRFAGCVLGVWSAQGGKLGTPVQGIRVGERGYAFLVDDVGTVLHHPQSELIGTNRSWHPAVEALGRGQKGVQTVREGGRTSVVGYAPVNLDELPSSLFADGSWHGWGLLTSELWDDIVVPLRPYLRLMIVLLVLLVSTPLVILALAGNRIASPLHNLVTQVRRVSSGEYDTQVSAEAGPTEVRDLGLAFNQMVTQLRSSREDIRNYVVSILNSQEQERKRVARELHDETAQALIVLGRRIEAAQEVAGRRPPASLDELGTELERVRDLVDDTLHGVRRFTRDLRPPLLDELGLARSLDILGSRTEREDGIAVDVQLQGAVQPLSPALELTLYRLAQEALSNVRRHARASRAVLTLNYRPNTVVLEVQDNGIGFDAPTDSDSLMNSGRLGLVGIHERARLFGGRATITSSLGEGTNVRVIIPMSTLAQPNDQAQDQQI